MAGPLSKYKKTDGDVVPELLVINFDGIAVDWSWWQRVEVVRVFYIYVMYAWPRSRCELCVSYGPAIGNRPALLFVCIQTTPD